MSPFTLEKEPFIKHMSQDDPLSAFCVASVHLKENYFYVVKWDRVNTLAFRRTLQYYVGYGIQARFT